jgi:hypothetical protein
LAERLLHFASADFSEVSKELVRELFVGAIEDGNRHLRRDILLLVGVADLRSELPRLKKFIDENEDKLKQKHEKRLAEWRQVVERMPERRRAYYAHTLLKQYWQSSLVWAALRARARMGLKEDTQRCIELVESHPDEDYRVIRLLKELSYVRQAEVVDYLWGYLVSDKETLYRSNDVVPSRHASVAAEALSEMLGGFPSKRGRGADPETVKRCRKWMAEQKQKQQQAEKPEEKQWDIIR